MDAKCEGTDILCRFTGDEALVLYDWLSRATDEGTIEGTEGAVETVLVRLEGALEKNLTVIVAPDYLEQLEAARQRLGP